MNRTSQILKIILLKVLYEIQISDRNHDTITELNSKYYIIQLLHVEFIKYFSLFPKLK